MPESLAISWAATGVMVVARRWCESVPFRSVASWLLTGAGMNLEALVPLWADFGHLDRLRLLAFAQVRAG
jgi:hypothetical protein